jgi:hypothetical protein
MELVAHMSKSQRGDSHLRADQHLRSRGSPIPQVPPAGGEPGAPAGSRASCRRVSGDERVAAAGRRAAAGGAVGSERANAAAAARGELIICGGAWRPLAAILIIWCTSRGPLDREKGRFHRGDWGESDGLSPDHRCTLNCGLLYRISTIATRRFESAVVHCSVQVYPRSSSCSRQPAKIPSCACCCLMC